MLLPLMAAFVRKVLVSAQLDMKQMPLLAEAMLLGFITQTSSVRVHSHMVGTKSDGYKERVENKLLSARGVYNFDGYLELVKASSISNPIRLLLLCYFP